MIKKWLLLDKIIWFLKLRTPKTNFIITQLQHNKRRQRVIFTGLGTNSIQCSEIRAQPLIQQKPVHTAGCQMASSPPHCRYSPPMTKPWLSLGLCKDSSWCRLCCHSSWNSCLCHLCAWCKTSSAFAFASQGSQQCNYFSWTVEPSLLISFA